MTATLTKLTGILVAGLAILTTACAPGVALPNGRYYDAYGFQEHYIDIKDDAVVDGKAVGRGGTDFTKYTVLEYNELNGAARIQTAYGAIKFYCDATKIDHDALRAANVDFDRNINRAGVTLECTRHGWMEKW